MGARQAFSELFNCYYAKTVIATYTGFGMIVHVMSTYIPKAAVSQPNSIH